MTLNAFHLMSCLMMAGLAVACVPIATGQLPVDRYTGAWNVEALQNAAVEFQWDTDSGATRGLYYEGEPYRGQATRVFARCAMPVDAQTSGRQYPAVVLVHGGGGTAFEEWAALWAQRGYVALAMDLAGRGPDGQRLADGGPDQGGHEKFAAIRDGVTEVWSYHTVANVMRAVGVLRGMPEVDPQRIGITGISWGGYLTCIVAGLDDRLRVAVPVYGCGFLLENSPWRGEFDALGAPLAEQWDKQFDPAHYLPHAKMPMLFVTGARDPAYPLDSHQKSSRLPQNPVTLCIKPDMEHGHSHGWAPAEIGYFVDAVLKPAAPGSPTSNGLARIDAVKTQDRRCVVTFASDEPIARAELCFTTDTGAWSDRQWQVVPMALESSRCWVELPEAPALTWFVNLIDDRGAVVSTPYETVPQTAEGTTP